MKTLAPGVLVVMALAGCGGAPCECCATALLNRGPAALAACGNRVERDPCDQTSKCSADPVRHTDEISCPDDTYPGGAAPRCNAEAVSFGYCARVRQACGPDHKTDGAATLALCRPEYEAYVACNTAR